MRHKPGGVRFAGDPSTGGRGRRTIRYDWVAPTGGRNVKSSRPPPSSRSGKTLRFRVRPGLEVPFTRLDAIVVEIGVVADAGGYATLIEVVRLGEGLGEASHLVWHVNPSERQVSSLSREQAESQLRSALFRARYSLSRLRVGGRPVELVEFDHPIEDGPFVLIAPEPGETVTPPAWATEDVTHDPSTEIPQVVLDAWRNRAA